jgi:hypothetical protein
MMVRHTKFYVYDYFKLYLEVLTENNDNTLDDNQLHEKIIYDCLSNVTEQVADAISTTDIAMIDPTTDQNKTSKT